ncbi:hypothetical protein [Haloarcula marismortui]|nr:hypothetical protein [Haloarcula californiae]
MAYDCLLCLLNSHESYDCPEQEGICDMPGQPHQGYIAHLQECDGSDAGR